MTAKPDIRKIIQERVLVTDGGTGTYLQTAGLKPEDFGGARYEGCNERLCELRPDVIGRMHDDYLDAGADIIETNSFGAISVVLAEYGLEGSARALARKSAELASRCAAARSTPEKPRFAAGSMGPTNKSIFVIGGTGFDELKAAYLEQALGLIEGGADLLIVETAHDIINLKAGLEAAFVAGRSLGREVPVIASATFDRSGLMLSGQNVEAFYAALEYFPLLAIGCNCGAGPEQMGGPLRTLAAISRFPLFCMANNGLPDENGRYCMTPDQFAEAMLVHAKKGLLNIMGGCCGTSTPHIKALSVLAKQAVPFRPLPESRRAVSGAEALFFDEVDRPVLVGERANSIGSKIFRELVAQGKWDEAVGVARRQAKAGAQILDICLANPERDEKADSAEFLSRVTRAVRTPLMVDTTNFEVAEAAAKNCPGKIIWNSVNLEHGPDRLMQAARLNRRFGTALVVGCIDELKEEGMALTAARKLEVARRAHKLLAEGGVPDSDIIFDALVFPVASGQEKYATAAAETAAAIALLRREFPGCATILGVSNVSFGLPPAAREALNSIFLHQCVGQGLDMAIVNTEKMRRHASLSEEEKKRGEELLSRASAERAASFTALYRAAQAKPAETGVKLPPAEFLKRAVLDGSCEGVAEAALAVARETGAQAVINGPLSLAMAEVGKLFAGGELIVTEVLQSAQAMKTAVDALEPELKKSAGGARRGSILLATVRGDVHDIGKNLVRIIFESNGFAVRDLGVQVPNEEIVRVAREIKPDAIGLSGLLTRSAEAMISVAADLKAAGVEAPLLAGGAPLSEKFVALKLAPKYSGPVFYAADAMRGLEAVSGLLSPQRAEVVQANRQAQERLCGGH